jgi:dephospho-CoA kinase
MLVAGLTGNIGMGKSYVLSVFEGLGAITIDSDGIVDILMKDRLIIKKIAGLLGNEVIQKDGGLDKTAIANIIFNNNMIRAKLEALLHPLVFKKIDSFLAKIRKKKCLVIVEVPLLFEGNYQKHFDRTITVYTNKKTAFERLKLAGISKAQAIKRMNAQMPIATKKKLADYTIDNSGTKQDTRRQVKIIYGMLLDEMVSGVSSQIRPKIP